MQYAVSLVLLQKKMALTFSDVRKSLKGNAAVIPYAKSLLGHYRYDYNNGTLSRGDMDTGHRVIVSGHMEQDSLGEDVFVVNIRMNIFNTNEEILSNVSRAFDEILFNSTMLGQRVVRSAILSRIGFYRHTAGGNGGEQTVRFNAEDLLQTDEPPYRIPEQERKYQFFFKIPVRATEVETFERRVARLNESIKEDSNGDFVPVINWMNQRVEVFLEHMGRGNFAVLFRVVESSLVGHDIEDVLGTLDVQIRRELSLSTQRSVASWIITPLGPQSNDTTRIDWEARIRRSARRTRGRSTRFYESDAIPEYTTNLQTGNSRPPVRPREVQLGRTFTVEEFQNLGPFYISEKLILDDLTQDEEYKAGCRLTDFAENIEYPMLVTSENDERVYCAEEIAEWVGGQRKTLNEYRVPIVSIHVMTREEVVAKEKAKLEEEKEKLKNELKNLLKARADVRDIRRLRYKISNIDYGSLKAKRVRTRNDKKNRENEGQQPAQQRRRLRLLDMSMGALKF